MEKRSRLAVLGRLIGSAAIALGLSQAIADPTSFEITGLLYDGSGNRITATPYMIFSEGIYDSPTGGTLLASLGTENVQVNNGSFLQVFGLDDAIFASTTYLQINLNGFDMSPRLGIFYNGTYFAAHGITSGPASFPFVLYAGNAAAIPEPAVPALLIGGLLAVAARRRWR
jgi:hypothetical protein